MTNVRFFAAAALFAAASLSATAQQVVYAIGDGGASLVRFNTNTPGNVTTVANFTGAATFLDAIDFRPATNQLYGYLDSSDTFFTVNVDTGVLTTASVGANAAPTNTFQLGMDFNPNIDRLRVVTDSAQNIVFNPITGTAASFTNTFYAVGDRNEGANPALIDNAYSQNTPGNTATLQYAIDYGLDALVRLDNNAGTLTTVGLLGVDTDIYTGFDIFTSGTTDTAYAILTAPGGTANFYTINLSSGAATLVGAVGAGAGQVYSLAVMVPTPAALAALAGAAAFGIIRRRR